VSTFKGEGQGAYYRKRPLAGPELTSIIQQYQLIQFFFFSWDMTHLHVLFPIYFQFIFSLQYQLFAG
jgi:hypothetical protein